MYSSHLYLSYMSVGCAKAVHSSFDFLRRKGAEEPVR